MIHRDWLLWQLNDSAFPTGGFAHSCGLEAAKQGGHVRSEADLLEFAQVVLQQTAETVLPYVETVYQEPEQLTEADQHCDAFLVNPIANRASSAQGHGLIAATAAAFPEQGFVEIKKLARTERWPCHLAPVYGWVMQRLQIALEDACRSMLFASQRTVLSAAIRLSIIGPLRCQALQYELGPIAEKWLERAMRSARPLDYRLVAQSALTLDAWQSSHDRLYSRLFHS